MFDDIKALFRHETIDHKPSMWIMHRFLASEMQLAYVASKYAQWIRCDSMTFQFWRAVVPKRGKAPYLKYIAAKKAPAPPELAQRAMEVYGWNRQETEEALDIIELSGETLNVANYLGVEL